ncbi:MAG: MerR family transcriptional regulator [Bdellovibrionaceae bacterium]|nr:MerR family transcriptional regulator [Pseudobdellovibrionaceae bacterium]
MSYLDKHKQNNTSNLSSKTHVKNIPDAIEVTSAFNYLDPQLKKELNNIPDRIYFKIGEVANLLEVKSSVLRYWETEFPSFSPNKSGKNQRMYKKKDVEQLFLIKKLLYRDRFSIEGARGVLAQAKKEFKGFFQEKQIRMKMKNSLSLAQLLLIDIQNCKKLFV